MAECERVKRAATDDATLAAQQHEARFVRTWKDALGMLRLAGALEPLPGAKLVAELERRADRLFREQSRAKGPIDTLEQRLADALAELLGELGGAGTAKRKGPRTVVRLIVTKAAAERGSVATGEKCQTADGTQVPLAAVYDALLDDDTLIQEVEVDAVDVRSIRTMKKYIPRPLRDALEAQGMVCVVPGCGCTKGLQIDHTQERRRDGPTELARISDGSAAPTTNSKPAAATTSGATTKATGTGNQHKYAPSRGCCRTSTHEVERPAWDSIRSGSRRGARRTTCS